MPASTRAGARPAATASCTPAPRSATTATPATPTRGDGVLQAGEEWDDGNTGNNGGCRTNCKKARCGDGFTRTGVEACDDGNTRSGDGCSADCTKETSGAGDAGAGGDGGSSDGP